MQSTQCSSLIDTSSEVASLIDSISDLPTHPPSLYIDLEGANLGRHGTISILQLYVLPTNQTHLIDIHSLKEAAFTTPGSNGQTLKGILESSTIPKAFFDIRNDSDALYSHFSIKLACIQDIQLMELATRSFSKRCVSGLAKCMEKECTMTPRERQTWLANKAIGVRLFLPTHGGSYEVFNRRPLSEEIIKYCVQDVQFLPRLWQHYSSKLSPSWNAKVEKATRDRVLLSQSPTFNGKGRHMALGPW